MKTIPILLTTLVAIATAVPTRLRTDGVEHESRLNGAFKTVKRETKSATQDSPAELSLHHESGSTLTKDHGKSPSSFRKPIIVKKKFGYHIYRDSDEELSQAEPRENCRRQFRFKLCDESGEPAANNMRSINENIDETDVEHSLKLAKEAVEILQRDLQKIEENTKLIQKNRVEEELEGKLHKTIEQARQPLEQLNENIGNLDALSLKTVTSKESNMDTAISKSEETRMAQWKEAIENIQKNVEIVKNIEDAFKTSEQSRLSSDEETVLTKTKNVETLEPAIKDLHTSESNVKAREMDNLEGKNNENLFEDNQAKNAENDMESFATVNKQVDVGLHSDSLKLENTANWDITENVRHAENDQQISKQDDKLQDIDSAIGKPQEKDAETSVLVGNWNTLKEGNLNTELKSAQYEKTDNGNQLLKNADATDEGKVKHIDDSMLSSSHIVKDVVKDEKIRDEPILKSAEDMDKTMDTVITKTDLTKELNAKDNNVQEKDAQISESRNIVQTENIIDTKEAIMQDSRENNINLNDKKKIGDSDLRMVDVETIMRSTGDISVTKDMDESKITGNNLNMRQTILESSGEKQIFEKSSDVKAEQELKKTSEAEEKLDDITQGNEPHQTISGKTDFVKSSDFDESQTKIDEKVDAKLSAEKQTQQEDTVLSKSVNMNIDDRQPSNFNNDQTVSLNTKNDRKILEERNNMRFADESGDIRRSQPQLLVNNLDSDKTDIQQRMSEMDFFNNLNSQHTAQLVQDKNLDYHTSSHINQGMSEWDRNQQQLHSMMNRPFIPWLQGRQRNNMDIQVGNHNHHDHQLGNIHLEDHQHDHHLNNLHFDSHHHQAMPMGRFVNNIQTGINQEMLNSPMMRDNILENGGSLDLDSSMQPSMQMNMRDAFDQNGHWNYHHTSGKAGFGPNMNLVGSGPPGSAVGVFPNANSGCGIPLLLSCSPSVVSGSLAKQPSLGYSGHGFRSGDDLRFYNKRDAQGINEILPTKVKTFASTSV